MAVRFRAPSVATGTLALLLAITAMVAVSRAQDATPLPLALDTARVTLAGTSNIHDYTATTSTVRLTSARLVQPVADANGLVAPGAVEGFEVAVPAATLVSDKDGLNKNMHKALRADKHPNIVFRLARIEAAAGGALKAVGTLQIAGQTKEMAFDLTTERQASSLKISGRTNLLMTDFGIAPPKAMLGMLKTDPKVTVTFEALLSLPRT